MTETASQTSGTKTLRPRARILRTLGDELISSETVAVIELVKNAYDADATRVLIRFHGPLSVGQGRIEVIDNGHGMSLETIQNSWMEPATLAKKRRNRSEQLGRRVLGEKGIGRFAASRLAERLEVVTRRAEMDHEIWVYFDWGQFDDEEKYLDQVEVLWEEVAPIEIRSGGSVEALWIEDDKKLEPDDLKHGTLLRMDGLRTVWGKNEFEALRTGLSRLVSPFFKQNGTQDDEFIIRLQFPPPFEGLSGYVEPPEALQKPHYSLSGHVTESGEYDLKVRLRDQANEERLTGQFRFVDGHRPECGPFYIELRVWDRESRSLRDLAQEYRSTIQDFRRDLDSVAGINVYRDGFRVFPYGEPGNDWLRLDLRRVQNPTLRLSNNQVVGYVLVSADKNPKLRDQSNREGLMEGPALNDLRELVTMVLNELETRRYNIRHPKSPEAPDRQPGGLFVDFDLAKVRALVRQRHPDDAELLALIGETETDLERRVLQVQEVLGRYRRLATLGQLIDVVLHEGRSPLAKIGTEAHLGLRDIERAPKNDETVLDKLKGRFRTIRTQSDVLATVFRKIEPFGGRKRGRPTRVRLEQVIADAFSVLDADIADAGVEISLPTTDTSVTADPGEIQQVIINLLQNSLYWLQKVPKDQRKIAVQVHRAGPEEVEIVFSDNGPGVEPPFRERIFEPYFSRKPDGVGLGLTHTGEIVSDYYGGDLELLDGGPLPGATFRVTLRKRV